MKRLGIAVVLAGLTGCAATKDFFAQRFLPDGGGIASVSIRAGSVQAVTEAITTRMTGKGWKPVVPPPQNRNLSFSQEYKGPIAYLFYQTGPDKAVARYDFSVSSSTDATAVEGQFVLLRNRQSSGEVVGGKNLERLQAMLNDLKAKFEEGLPPAPPAPMSK